jgi:hypothetical protein
VESCESHSHHQNGEVRRRKTALGNSTGNPGVRQAYPDPYPQKPIPALTGMGFRGYGSGVSRVVPGFHVTGNCVRAYTSPYQLSPPSTMHQQSQDNDNDKKEKDNEATTASHVDMRHGDSEVTKTRPKTRRRTCFGPLVPFFFFSFDYFY